MKRRFCVFGMALFAVLATRMAMAQDEVSLRPPSVPLVAVDPYFSIWSAADKLNDADKSGNPTIVHWTGGPNQLTSLARIDGKPYRIMGIYPKEDPALPQTRLRVLPTTVTYSFEGGGVRLSLSFMTPLIPYDLMVLSRPVTYLTWQVVSIDGKQHDVQVYYDNTAELVVNAPETEKVTWASEKFGNIGAMKVGSADQPVLRQKGDRIRINWGYEYVAVPASQDGKMAIAPAASARKVWGQQTATALVQPPIVAANAPVLSVTFNLGKVGAEPVSRWLILAYDDVYSAQFFRKNLKGYWKKDGAEIGDLLKKSVAEYDDLRKRCAKFDDELMADLKKAGGPKYAWIGALAYRQSLAASKVVADGNGQPLFFCKENTSNGCMGTVDVFYPQSPLPLLISPSLSRAMLIPVLEYTSSPRWKWPNAPHDVGTWPLANDQVYGGVNTDGAMPVEETGNMLLLVAAVAQLEGNANFAVKYWPTLTKWAEYLKSKGFDPENQLCTDDFAGKLAHNVNLSAKAICALGAYGKLASMKGDKAVGEEYTKLAKEFAVRWIKEADDGDHFRLTFDKPATWSSKYNLVWDKILEMNLFPEEAIKKEVAFYRRNIDKYGLPLDGRKQRAGGRGESTERMAYWSKTDWAYWVACLTGSREDFDAITNPVYNFYNEATQRVGLTDLYYTDLPDAARMHSRPVIGGLFLKMLYDRNVWKKWSSRDQTKANGPWAPLPQMKTAEVVKPGTAAWRYTTEQPGENWFGQNFNDSAWKQGQGGFGANGRTGWNTSDIWLRGEITVPEGNYNELQISLFHSGDAEVYIDGQQAVRITGRSNEYSLFAAGRRATLKPGKSLFAVHCKHAEGGQFVDMGIVDILPVK